MPPLLPPPSRAHLHLALSRRRWLWLCTSFIGGASLPGCADNPQPTPGARGAPGTASPEALYALVNRLSWGANDTELQRASQSGWANWLARQFEPASDAGLPEPVRQRLSGFTISQKSLPDLLSDLDALRDHEDKQVVQKEMGRLAHEAAQRQLLRALYSPQTLRERLTWFWFNHFNVHMHKHELRAMVGDYQERALRPHALGSFRAMLGAVVRHPAMLRYLDNDQNAADHVNENLARELMELHTLGVNGGYTQKDVQELARVLTGHAMARHEQAPKAARKFAAAHVRDGAYEFNPGRHDFGDKTVLGRRVAGRGADELDEVLDMLVAHPATGRFVTAKLARYLAGDTVPEPVLRQMAERFTRSQGRIDEALRPLIDSPLLRQRGPVRFKDPMQLVVSAVRAAYDDHVITNPRPLVNWLNRLGEGLYNRLTPDGYPQDADAWNSSGQMAARFEVMRAIGTGAAGLFKPDDPTEGNEQPAFPQLARASYYQYVRPLQAEDTRKALDMATSPQEWNALYLCAPEFQYV